MGGADLAGLFGTDGVRGVAGEDLTPELAVAVGRALALRLRAHAPRPQVLVGRDSRLSGPMLEGALTAGLMAGGCDADLCEVLPTPAISYLVRESGYAAGVVLSASHNPVPDNGIKIFGPDGLKLADAEEAAIESLVLDGAGMAAGVWPIGPAIGAVRSVAAEMRTRYAAHLRASGPPALPGWRIVVDSGHGAASGLLSEILRSLGAEVVAISDTPDGARINVDCGATAPDRCAEMVRESGAHVGFTFDGDADRCIAVDEHGDIVNGDGILATLALWLRQHGRLRTQTVVATTMSNGGLAHFLTQRDMRLLRTEVGDRYVARAMFEEGHELGGEQSGHILMPHLSPTGDGELTAMVLLRVLSESGSALSACVADLTVMPQRLENVPRPGGRRNPDWHTPALDRAVEEAQQWVGPSGRVVVRPSGTEPLLRIMVEADDEGTLRRALHRIREATVSEPVG